MGGCGSSSSGECSVETVDIGVCRSIGHGANDVQYFDLIFYVDYFRFK